MHSGVDDYLRREPIIDVPCEALSGIFGDTSTMGDTTNPSVSTVDYNTDTITESLSHLNAASLFSVQGIVAVVTGGGTGIGLMITRALFANGASRIYIIGRRFSVLSTAASSLDPSRKTIIPLAADVTDRSSLHAAMELIRSETGYINLLFCNAGIMGPRPRPTIEGAAAEPISDKTILENVEAYSAHLLSQHPQDFNRTYEINVGGVYNTCMTFLPLLAAGNTISKSFHLRSQIIATSSIGGFSRLPGASFAYNSSKAALTHMMKMMATSFVPFKIRANVFAPGIFPTELAGGTMNNLVHKAEGKGDGEGVFKKEFVPAERAGSEEDVSGAVLWMASRAGAYLNGSVVVVDGGRLGVLNGTY